MAASPYPGGGDAVTARQQLIELTAAQTEVLTRVAQGLDFPQIAKHLGLSVTEARLRNRGAYGPNSHFRHCGHWRVVECER